MQPKRKYSKRMEDFSAHDANDSDASLASTNSNDWSTMVYPCRWRRHACFRHVFPAIGNRPMNTTTMMLVLFYTLVFVTLNYCVDDTVAFNLENRLPIVKYGDADTYFGYSVAGHMIENDEDDDDAGGGGGSSSGPTEKW